MKKLMFLSTLSMLLFIGKGNAQWSRAGNGIIPGDFLGSTNGVPLEFKVDGNQAGWLDYTSPYNTTLGYEALIATSPGTNNTAIGLNALANNKNLSNNTAVGDSALRTQSNNNALNTNNVAVGNSALYQNNPPASGYSRENTVVGQWAMRHNGTGFNNTALGFGVVYKNVQGFGITGTGYEALAANGGIDNTATGYEALFSNTVAHSNAAMGNDVGYKSTGYSNTFMGDSAGWDNGAGDSNIYIGYQAGGTAGWSTVNNSVWIGYQAGPGSVNSNYIYFGNANTTAIVSYSVGSLSVWSDRRIKDNIKENVPGLAFINRLVPVTFNYDVHKENQMLGVKDNPNHTGKYAVEEITQSGFIAQQVDSAAQACGYDFNGVIRPKSPNELYSLGYTDFVVPLVKAAQDLNVKNDSLLSTIDSLRNAFKSIRTCLNQICSATGDNTIGNENSTIEEQNITLNSVPLLYQNSPNPFSTGTKINYFLPEGTVGATIVFYDNYGNPLKTVALSQTGNNTLNITVDNLSSSIYSYSLIVNGNLIDTKKMVLQK